MSRRSVFVSLALAVACLVLAVPGLAHAAVIDPMLGWNWQNPVAGSGIVRDVAFADAHTGYLVGENERIFKTFDSGHTWMQMPSPDADGNQLWGVSAPDDRHVYACGDEGAVYASDDGGWTWRETYPMTLLHVYGLDFPTAQEGWIAVLDDGPYQGGIYHTTDGGATWQWQLGTRMYHVAMADTGYGWATDYYSVYRYWNGSWDYIASPEDVAIAGIDVRGDKAWVARQDGSLLKRDGTWWITQQVSPRALTSVRIIDDTTAWVTDAGGSAWLSTDGGDTWTEKPTGTTGRLCAVSSPSTDTAVVTGFGGVVARTADAGATWSNGGAGSGSNLQGASFISSSLGWAVGGDGALMHTQDGGASWESSGTGLGVQSAVRFVNGQTGWIGSDRGLFRTTDGGKSWDTTQSTGDVRAITFRDAQHGWAAGRLVSQSYVLRTTNGGSSWTTATLPATDGLPTAVTFTDLLHGCVVTSQGDTYTSSDGGVSWTKRTLTSAPYTTTVAMAGFGSKLWIGGNDLWRSTDYGVHWTQHAAYFGLGRVTSFTFFDANNGWGTDDKGWIGKTTDGAGTWTGRGVSATSLNALAFSGVNDGWAVGDGGAILNYHRPTTDRLYGADRYATSVAASKATFKTSNSVVIATGLSYPDALCGTSLAGALDAPLLLTANTWLPDSVAQELTRLGVKNVYIVGNTSGVAPAVETTLKRKYTVTRIQGSTMYDTAAAVARKVHDITGASFGGQVFIVTGGGFADALAVAPLAASQKAPILFANGSVLPSAEASALADIEATSVLIAGSTKSVGLDVETTLTAKGLKVERRWGVDRYATAVDVIGYANARGWATPSYLGVTAGYNFPDALVAGVVAGRNGGAVVLSQQGSLPAISAKLTSAVRSKTRKAVLFGSTKTLSDAVRSQF
jgi:photosystem II stability/assembly factor-like uncharacterized protein/putative cell wall-binding protein